MSLLQNSNAIPTGVTGYNLTDSVRFRSSASANLTRTFPSAGNRKTWTFSCWFKRGTLGTTHTLLGTGPDTSNQFDILFSGASDSLLVIEETGNVDDVRLGTNATYRDPSAWYHIVVAYDTTQATASNRVKLYVNGEQITSLSSSTYPSQNFNSRVNNNTAHAIGSRAYNTSYFDGYMTEINFVDGQQLTPSDFGEYDDTTGVWKPKEYTGTYGTNGFYLPMKATTQASGFNTVLYTGNGGTQSITGVGFSPDLVWIKCRSILSGSITGHQLLDTIRGASNELSSHTTNAEGILNNALYGDMTSFDSDGFTVTDGTDPNNDTYNGSNDNYVAWCWEAGGTAVANTDGDISSQVSANTAKGFSIVTYTGTQANATVGHGLGVAPKFIITKCRSSANGWPVYHYSLSATKFVRLNETAAAATNSIFWNNTEPTNNVFTIGANDENNKSGATQVAYCFAEVAGFSKFGSYTGNGSTTGPTVTTGFRPAFVMIKDTTSAYHWRIFDNTRSPSNPANKLLTASNNNVELTETNVNFTDTGFEITGETVYSNTNGNTYIYMAFADTRDAQFNFDASGNKNNWTPTNINSNASSETTYDIMSDVPTLTDEDTGNYPTINPLNQDGTHSSAFQGNLEMYSASSSWGAAGATMEIPSSGKWYWETTNGVSSTSLYYGQFGIWETTGISNIKDGFARYVGTSDTYGKSYAYATHNGKKYTNGASATFAAAATAVGDVIGIAFDADAGTLSFYKNGSSLGTAFTGLTSRYVPAFSCNGDSGGTFRYYVNFGQRPFAYTPPTGFKKLNTYNLPDSTIKDGSKYFDIALTTGNGTSGSVTGIGFSPDFVWTKNRNYTYTHGLVNSVVGTDRLLQSSATSAEYVNSQMITSLNSDGFDYGNNVIYNDNTRTYVHWMWRGSDSSPVFNTDGDTTSTVSANPTAGFSVVSWTADNSASTRIGHGLGTTPKIAIIKNRDTVSNWQFYTTIIDGTYDFLYLNLTNAKSDSGLSTFTSTTFAAGGTNTNTDNMIAYCFAEVEGFSKFGSYTGNGSTNGPFVYTGFRPAWVMIKPYTTANNWQIIDTARNLYNNAGKHLYADLSNAEADSTNLDICANGWKSRQNLAFNTNGVGYIYMAFAENPFKNSLAR